jgi:glycosyltransferase involved in cell wall biosynthesis
VEVIVVDDHSNDRTPYLIRKYVKSHSHFRLIQTGRSLGTCCSRNLGVKETEGNLLFFCDGDDRYLKEHIYVCYEAKQAHPNVGFVKTRVLIEEEIHPRWEERIDNSMVLNLAVGRKCHEFIEGFDETLGHSQGEDCLYNVCLGLCFEKTKIPVKTVQYMQRPGNALERLLKTFQRDPELAQETLSPADNKSDQAFWGTLEKHKKRLLQKMQQHFSESGKAF